MSPGLNHNKGPHQFFLRMGNEHAGELLVHHVLSRRQDAQVDHATFEAPDKDKPAKVPVASDKDTALLLS